MTGAGWRVHVAVAVLVSKDDQKEERKKKRKDRSGLVGWLASHSTPHLWRWRWRWRCSCLGLPHDATFVFLVRVGARLCFLLCSNMVLQLTPHNLDPSLSLSLSLAALASTCLRSNHSCKYKMGGGRLVKPHRYGGEKWSWLRRGGGDMETVSCLATDG